MAQKNADQLWVTVKGYPKGTPRTKPSTQARHWFEAALFDVVDWHGENANVAIVCALPDYKVYRKLAQRVSWLQRIFDFTFMWVKENDEVTWERV